MGSGRPPWAAGEYINYMYSHVIPSRNDIKQRLQITLIQALSLPCDSDFHINGNGMGLCVNIIKTFITSICSTGLINSHMKWNDLDKLLFLWQAWPGMTFITHSSCRHNPQGMACNIFTSFYNLISSAAEWEVSVTPESGQHKIVPNEGKYLMQ